MKQLALGLEPNPPRQSRTGSLRSYHARSHVTPAEAIAGEARAQRQEERVLAWMRANRGRWTPWEVSEATAIFVVSCRRALTNLAHAGLLHHWPGDRREAGPLRAKSGTWEAAISSQEDAS